MQSNAFAGKSSDYTYIGTLDPSIPENNNRVCAGFTVAKDGPEKCKDLFKKSDPADDMFNLCSIPVTQISNNCKLSHYSASG